MENQEIQIEQAQKVKPGPKRPRYEGGCRNNPNSKSYRPNQGVGKGTIKNKQYKNKLYQKITLAEYAELLEYKQKYMSLAQAQ
jgi:hypothetical protein